MHVERWTGPPVETHTYLLVDEPTREAWVIDAPLETAASVLVYARVHRLSITRVVLTHGHFDHILDVERYREAGIPIAASPREREMFEAPQTALFGLPFAMPQVRLDEALEEGQVLRLGECRWEVWEAPGHSPGHLLLYSAERGMLFGGDLLFREGYGRIDFPGCDAARMRESLRRLLALPDETRVYPGHGPETTIGRERAWLEPLLASGRL